MANNQQHAADSKSNTAKPAANNKAATASSKRGAAALNKKPTAGANGHQKPAHRHAAAKDGSQHQHTNAAGTHAVTKRPTAKLSQRPNDIYVSNKSDFRAQLKQCNTLLSTSDFHEVFLHSIGAAVTRAINLALTLVSESQGGLGYEANTSTIELTDNLHPLHDDGDFAISSRRNSCLHVRVFRHCRDVLLESTVAETADQQQ